MSPKRENAPQSPLETSHMKSKNKKRNYSLAKLADDSLFHKYKLLEDAKRLSYNRHLVFFYFFLLIYFNPPYRIHNVIQRKSIRNLNILMT